MYQYRVVTHAGAIHVEYRKNGTEDTWNRVQSREWDDWYNEYCYTDNYFFTVWGAKRWIRRQVKKDKMSAKLEAEKAKDPVVVWGPYP